jgi:hypothetical protein
VETKIPRLLIGSRRHGVRVLGLQLRPRRMALHEFFMVKRRHGGSRHSPLYTAAWAWVSRARSHVERERVQTSHLRASATVCAASDVVGSES